MGLHVYERKIKGERPAEVAGEGLPILVMKDSRAGCGGAIAFVVPKKGIDECAIKRAAKDVLITSQLRTAMILSKVIKSSNYTLETINKKIYIFGIAMNEDEKKLVIEEADKIYGVQKVIPVIYLVEDLSRSKS